METAMQYKVRGETLVRANYKTGSTVSLTNDKIILNDFPQLRAAATNGSSRLTTFYYKKKTVNFENFMVRYGGHSDCRR